MTKLESNNVKLKVSQGMDLANIQIEERSIIIPVSEMNLIRELLNNKHRDEVRDLINDYYELIFNEE